MIVTSRLTSSERTVLVAALREYRDEAKRTLKSRTNADLRYAALWRRFEAERILAEIE